MTKFEEELFNKVKVTNIELTTEAEYKKSTLINHFKNWHSDEEFQELKESYWNQAESILSMLDEIKSLKSQLQQQALPVVPECVAELIEWAKENGLSLKQIFVYDRYSDFPDADEWLGTNKEDGKGNKEHQDIFALAFITGKYEVEKPQLFYLRDELTGQFLAKDNQFKDRDRYFFWNGADPLTHSIGTAWKLSFTQEEIDSMQTGSYEQIKAEEEK